MNDDVIVKDTLTYKYDIPFSLFKVSILKYFIDYLIKNISKQQLCFIFKFSSSYAKPDFAYGKIATMQIQIPYSIKYCADSIDCVLNDCISSAIERCTIGDKTILWYASIKYYEYINDKGEEKLRSVEKVFIDNLNVHEHELRNFQKSEANNESNNTNVVI